LGDPVIGTSGDRKDKSLLLINADGTDQKKPPPRAAVPHGPWQIYANRALNAEVHANLG
jgi:hypothetical protein